MGAPVGFAYRSEFITDGEEAALIGGIAQVEFSTFEMRGVAAKRRVAFFGRSYRRCARVGSADPRVPGVPARENRALDGSGPTRFRNGVDQRISSGSANRLAP